jgi:hypothetical protein
MDDSNRRYISFSPKIKYALVFGILPILIAVTLVRGGSIGDIFTQSKSSRETSAIVRDAINEQKNVYGFSVATATDVDCKDKLKNKYNATIDCSVDAARTLGGKIQGPVTVTARVMAVETETAPMQIEITNIEPVK